MSDFGEVTGKVTQLSPLMVRAYGSSTAVPAVADAGVAPTVNAEVRLRDRSPLPPVVMGVIQ